MQPQEKRFLALGDSYTIGESVSYEDRWPVQLARRLNESGHPFARPDIIATTGWRTDELREAVQHAKPRKGYDLVSLLIGVNNQYQGKSIDEYEKEFEELLLMAISHARSKECVFVVSIPDYGYTPFGVNNKATISKEIDAFNEVNRRIAEQHGVQYFNITDLTRKGLDGPSLVAEDGLHPSGIMYRLWVDRIVSGLTFPK